ncbi:MAG: hypothetical protein R6U96_13920 [Promethearchaeia archaeon]
MSPTKSNHPESTTQNTKFQFNRCKFYVDTNNLINPEMIKTILEKFEDPAIKRLNQVISGIKFYIGGNHRHYRQFGYYCTDMFEYNFHNQTLLFFLSKMFESGFARWRSLLYGAIKRYVFESFCYEIVMALIQVMKLDTSLIEQGKRYYLNGYNEQQNEFSYQLFNYVGPEVPRVNFILICDELWVEPLPGNMGFLDVFYNRRMKKLKSFLNGSYTPNMEKVKIFNELRKIKMDYQYEYNLSELVNYCIHNKKHFEEFFQYNTESYQKLHRQFYYKAKRQILKFFRENEIEDELHEYKDSADRTHYFLTHQTFERVKSACLQICIKKLETEDIRKFHDFKRFYDHCPICGDPYDDTPIVAKFYFRRRYRKFKSILIERMQEASCLEDLNQEPDKFFGIPCEDCFVFCKNIEGKFSDLEEVQRFLIHYSTCPVCGTTNHKNYLLSFYYDERKKDLRENLLKSMYLKTHKGIELDIGIPCCNCFSNIFNEKPDRPTLHFAH